MKYILSADEIMEIIANELKLSEKSEIHFHWILEDQIGVSSCEIEVKEDKEVIK